ncbi:MAG: 30S ribosomal protein S16 [uncultured bacterium]|nr:MAG: 30S ribosomal protein S16 [uncultured bacterium]
MAVVIRFARRGAKGSPFYRIVAADKEFPRDGRYLEVLGHYHPKTKEIKLDNERVKYWIDNGAQSSKTIGQLLAKNGIV